MKSKKPKPQTLTIDTKQGRMLTPAGAFVLAGATGYMEDTPPDEKARALKAVQRILSAATAGGFTKREMLETIMARLEISARVGMLAVEAVNAAGTQTVMTILREEMPPPSGSIPSTLPPSVY
jgi:hypothetical protein